MILAMNLSAMSDKELAIAFCETQKEVNQYLTEIQNRGMMATCRYEHRGATFYVSWDRARYQPVDVAYGTYNVIYKDQNYEQ
jgi:transcription initiation factor IIE alpha subunit